MNPVYSSARVAAHLSKRNARRHNKTPDMARQACAPVRKALVGDDARHAWAAVRILDPCLDPTVLVHLPPPPHTHKHASPHPNLNPPAELPPVPHRRKTQRRRVTRRMWPESMCGDARCACTYVDEHAGLVEFCAVVQREGHVQSRL